MGNGDGLPDANINFDDALAGTRTSLTKLAEHWKGSEDEEEPDGNDSGSLASTLANLAADPVGLSRSGFEWSQKAGCFSVLPEKALQCAPVSESIGKDGLSASRAGGPFIPTHPALVIAPAPPCGFGVFTTANLAQGENLGEYTGEVRRYDVWCDEIKARKLATRGSDAAVPFIREELYAAWAGVGPDGAGVVVDACAFGNAMRFINCSCRPSCTFRSFGLGAEKHSRLRVVTLRDIAAWEQLSVDYGWYYDDATRADVRSQALEAYHEDLPGLQALEPTAEPEAPVSEALRVLAEALREARGPPLPPRSQARSFLRRFVDGEALARLLEAGRPGSVDSYIDIPDALWPLYEVVGASRVGIPCRCALDRSLNSSGLCSGIIGRPLQSVCTGREEVS